MKYGKGRTTLPHSERCRQRIMEELAKTDEGQRRIAEAGARLDRALVDMGEAIFREEQPAAQGEIAASSSVRAQVDSESARNPFSVDEPSESVIPDPVVEMPRDIVDDDAAIREAASRELDDAIRAGSSMELDVAAIDPVDGASVVARRGGSAATVDSRPKASDSGVCAKPAACGVNRI